MNTNFKNIDEYIAMQPDNVAEILEEIREIIRTIVPNAEEKISYGIPTFKFHGNLVHFAAYKKHIGFYPSPSGVEAYKKELKNYNTSKGTIQFQLNEPIPFELIKKIVAFRVEENINKIEKIEK